MSCAYFIRFRANARAPTRFKERQIPSLLDQFITKQPNYVDVVALESPLRKRDHLVLSFDFVCHWTQPASMEQLGRNFSKVDCGRIRHSLAGVDLSLGLVEEAYLEIQCPIQETDELHIRRKSVKSSIQSSIPRAIRRMIDNRSHLYARQTDKRDIFEVKPARKLSLTILCEGPCAYLWVVEHAPLRKKLYLFWTMIDFILCNKVLTA